MMVRIVIGIVAGFAFSMIALIFGAPLWAGVALYGLQYSIWVNSNLHEESK